MDGWNGRDEEESRVSCCWMTSRLMRHMKLLSVELWIEKVRETGCLEPALEHINNDDDLITQGKIY